VETVIHLRASARAPFFKLVLVTNASGLDRPEVGYGVSLLARRDEIWAKLDVGTQAGMDRLNKAKTPLARILENIRSLAQQRPVVIQTMVPAIDGKNPFERELSEYIARLNELKAAGAQIALVQIYSATRPSPHSECGHLPLMALSEIAKQVRASTSLRAEVF
jgi:wyosine [tRNA(Phe)-imidazoG37] synthetase (radical SAM superfamily)